MYIKIVQDAENIMEVSGRIVQLVGNIWRNLENKMGIRELARKYKTYEQKELARRSSRRKKIAPYKSLADKKIPVKKATKLKLTARNITRTIGNPYGTKFPKAKKTLRKVKKRKVKRKQKVVVIYR